MPAKESLYPKDWFILADEDLSAAEILLTAGKLKSAAFHIQQAVEKYLKGYLLSRGWTLRRIHELDELLDEAISFNSALKEFRSLCEVVTEYYIEDRYPFMIHSELTPDELDDAIRQVRQLVSLLEGKK